MLAPELGEVDAESTAGLRAFPAESRATCRACAVAPGADPRIDEDQLAFSAPARCCTYQPRLPNYVVGRILRAGGTGAERVRAKIASRAGVHPEGLWPSSAQRRAWGEAKGEGFGRNPAFTCPYWVEGTELACSIHAEREAVCRTWHCRYEHGARSHAAWAALHVVLGRIERALTEFCMRNVPEDAEPERFYLACAARVDHLTADEIGRMRTPGLRAQIGQLAERIAERDTAMPDVLQPRVRDWAVRAEGVLLVSLSRLDQEQLPPWIFELLSRLDGERPWRQALAETAAVVGDAADEALVRRLWDRGLVGPKDNSPDVSFSVIPGDDQPG